jgi:transcriptional regulator with XRE-family HTH domain
VLEKTIANNIRTLRKARKMTLQHMEDRTGLTKGYLSKIERGLKSPPFSTLNQIATALGVDLAFLLKKSPAPDADVRICYTENGQGERGRTEEQDARGYRYELLATGKPGKNMIPYIIDVAPQETQTFQHEGEEFLYVLEGKMEFSYDGQVRIMNKGDSVYFDSLGPHSGRALGKGKTRLLAVMYNYKRL